MTRAPLRRGGETRRPGARILMQVALRLSIGALLLLLPAADAAGQCVPHTFTVDSASDASDYSIGDGICQVSRLGGCTLRAAIQEANASACEPTTIEFAIAGNGPHVILVDTTPLPSLSRQVVIDGTTQPGSSPNTAGLHEPGDAVLQIELRGSGEPVWGLATSCPGGEERASVIRGLVLNGFGSYGFVNSRCDGVRFAGNYVGVSPDGLSVGAGSHAIGVAVIDAASNSIGGTAPAERNVIAGASNFNIALVGNQDPQDEAFRTWRNDIVNNFVGTNALGSNGIGGNAPISGNGIGVAGWGVNPVVSDPVSTTPYHEDGTLIAFNIVGGHTGRGIWLFGGTDDGGVPRPSVGGYVARNIVGHGVAARALLEAVGEGNVPQPEPGLANGAAGIELGDASNGTSTELTWLHQNAVTQSGVGIDSALDGMEGAQDNLIWNNASHGLRIANWSSLLGNRIWENGGLGIVAEIASADPLPWIVLDGDPGTTLSGSADLPIALPVGIQCLWTTIEVFASDACDPSGFGEGRELVDEIVLDGCPSAFAAAHASPYPRPWIAATASWTLGYASGPDIIWLPPISSDFSNCIADPVPEPGALSQLAAGIGLLSLLARRRGRARSRAL